MINLQRRYVISLIINQCNIKTFTLDTSRAVLSRLLLGPVFTHCSNVAFLALDSHTAVMLRSDCIFFAAFLKRPKKRDLNATAMCEFNFTVVISMYLL